MQEIPVCIVFAIVSLDIAMSHRACDGDAVDRSRQHIRCGVDARDIERSSGFHSCVCAVGSPETIVHDGSSSGRRNDPGRLGCGDRCKVNLIHHERFNDLGLSDRATISSNGSFAKTTAPSAPVTSG